MLGNYRDSAAQLREIENARAYDKAIADAYAGKMADAYNGFKALGDYKDSAKKAEIAGNLSRAGQSKKIADGVLIYEFHSLWGVANFNTNVITAAKYSSITYDEKNNSGKLGLMKVSIRKSLYSTYPEDA